MTLRDKAVSGAMWSIAQNWVNQFLSLFVFLLLARLLEPESFGLVALASVFVALLLTLANQGFSPAIVQREELEPGHLDTAFFANLAVSLLLAGLLFFLGPWIGKSFDQVALGPVLQWLSLAVVLNSISVVHSGILMREFKFKALTIRTLAATLMGGATGIAMALADYGVWALVGQQLVGGLAGTIILWFSSGWYPGLHVSIRHFRDLIGVSSHVLGVNLLTIFSRRMDDLLIGSVLGPVALGIYAIAYKVFITMVRLLVESLTKVALPTFSRMQGDKDRVRSAYYTAVQITASICIPSFAGVLLVSPDLIPFLFGDQWVESVPVAQFLMITGIVYSLAYFIGPVMMALGKSRWVFYLHLMGSIGNVVGFLIAVRWGIVAVAAAFSIRAIITFPIGLHYLKRLIDLSYRELSRRLRGPAGASVAMLLLIFILDDLLASIGVGVKLLIQIFAGVVVYTASLYILDRVLFKSIVELLGAVAGKIKPSKGAKKS